jgi:hypothetical protein
MPLSKASPALAALIALGALSAMAQPCRAQSLVEALDDPLLDGPITNEARSFLSNAALPSGLWRVDTSAFQVGGSSAASTLPPAAISRLVAPVRGPATVSFRWRKQGNFLVDRFRFAIEGQGVQVEERFDLSWTEQSFLVDPGRRRIAWEFERFGAGNNNLATLWLDEVVVTPIPNNPDLQTAVEHFGHTLHSIDWTAGTLEGARNETVAKSGPVEPGGVSSMVLEVEGPAEISFSWGIAATSDPGSVLAISINDRAEDLVETPGPLQRRSLDVGPGTHSLKFSYIRSPLPEEGGSEPENPDEPEEGPSEGYLDDLSIVPYGPDESLADAVDRVSGVYSRTWQRQTTLTRDGVDAAQVFALGAEQAERWQHLYIELPGGPGLLSFWTRLETEPGKAELRADLGSEPILFRNQPTSGWEKKEMNLGPGPGRVLHVRFRRAEDANQFTTRALLDLVSFLPGANNYQADLSIAQRGKPLRGNGVINRNGGRQTAVVSARARRPAGFFAVRARNGSPTDEDRVGLRGTGNRRHFDVLFVVNSGGQRLNFSAAYFAGRFQTLQLRPNATERHEIWVVRKRRSASGSHVFSTTGRSIAAPAKVDVVRTRLRIRR